MVAGSGGPILAIELGECRTYARDKSRSIGKEAGFRQEAVMPSVFEFGSQEARIVPADQPLPRQQSIGVAGQLFQQTEAIAVAAFAGRGQRNVKQDEVKPRLSHSLQRGVRCRNRGDLQGQLTGQETRKIVTPDCVIIHEQDAAAGVVWTLDEVGSGMAAAGGQSESKACSLARPVALGDDAAPHREHQSAADREPEAQTASTRRLREWQKKARQQLRVDSGSVIDHLGQDVARFF